MKIQPESGNVTNYAQFIMPALLAVAGVYFIVAAKGALLPFVLSAALAYVLNPFVNYFVVRGIKRSYVVAALYIGVGAAVCAALYIVVHLISPQMFDLQQSWPEYVDKIQNIIYSTDVKLTGKYPFLSQLHLDQKIIPVLSALPQYVLGMFPALSLIFVVPFITFFMLIGGPSLIDYILDHIPAQKTELALHIVSRINSSLGNYISGILTEAFMLFLIAFLGLSLLGLNYSAVIAVLIGFSSLIPYLGALVGAVAASIVAYLQFGSLAAVARVLLFFVCLRFFDDWFLQPYIMKRAVKLNPAVILLALMAGWEIGGFWGVVFSIPVTCIIKEILFISMELQETEFHWKPKPEPTRTSIPYT